MELTLTRIAKCKDYRIGRLSIPRSTAIKVNKKRKPP